MASLDDIALAGIANSSETALKMLMQERPEVAILDADFGGDASGYDTARTMQTTRTRAAILMIVPEIDPEKYRPIARRLGTSWSYVRRNSALKVDVFEVALKSALRGVQWIEPELTRPLKELWTIAAKARELEEKKSLETPVAVKNASRKMRPADIPQTKSESEQHEVDTAEIAAEVEDEIAPGIETQNTNDVELDDFKYTSVSVGHGGIGQDVKGVRRVS
jgi:DNA-binding NarL/FixJ family response regulator